MIQAARCTGNLPGHSQARGSRVAASCKGHFNVLGGQAVGLGADVIFKAGGKWWGRSTSPRLSWILGFSGLGSTTNLPGGQTTSPRPSALFRGSGPKPGHCS